MDSLPDLVLVKIFGYLDAEGLVNARDVCCRWRDLTEIESLWKNIKVMFRSSDFINLKKSVPYRCIKAAPRLGTLQFGYFTESQWLAINRIIKHHHPKIRRLELKLVAQHNFIKILSWFSNDLEELQLLSSRGYDFASKQFADGYFPKLTHLDINLGSYSSDWCSNICPWPNLQELFLHVTGTGLYSQFLSGGNLVELVLNTRFTLKKLCVSESSYDVNVNLDLLIRNFQYMLEQGFEELEEFCIYHNMINILKWRLRNLEGLELYPYTVLGNSCTDPYNGSRCYCCDMCPAALNSFESISNLTIFFQVECFNCISKFLRSPMALKLSDKLTLQECCCRYIPDKCMSSGRMGARLVTEVVIFIPNIQVLCFKGCSRFLNFSWGYFVDRYQHIKFDFEEISSKSE